MEEKGGGRAVSDVDESDWSFKYVVGAAACGGIYGYEDSTFRLYSIITRAEATTIVNNMLARNADYVDDHTDSLRKFADLSGRHWGYYQIMETINFHDYTKFGSDEAWTQ